MITTAFQKDAFQNTAFQIVRSLVRPRGRINRHLTGVIPVGSLRVITIKTVKNRRVE